MPTSHKVLIVESRRGTEHLLRKLRGTSFATEWPQGDTETDYRERLQDRLNPVLADYDLSHEQTPCAGVSERARTGDYVYSRVPGNWRRQRGRSKTLGAAIQTLTVP